jgi:hypothetical protein
MHTFWQRPALHHLWKVELLLKKMLFVLQELRVTNGFGGVVLRYFYMPQNITF